MDTKTASLLAVIHLPGYAVVFDYFAEKINLLEREVFNIDPADTERIIAAQRIARGARWVVEETREQIRRDIARAQASEPPTMSEKEVAELYIKSLQ